jgi:hypothetical protein
MEERAARDYEAMVTLARSRNIRIAFVTYPIQFPMFIAANSAIRTGRCIARSPAIFWVTSWTILTERPAGSRGEFRSDLRPCGRG